jgi:hypothetical protein
MCKKFFLLTLALAIVVSMGCSAVRGNLTLFSFPILGYSKLEDPNIIAAKAHAIRQEADGRREIASGVAKNIDPNNVHVAPPPYANDPRQVITGKVEGDRNLKPLTTEKLRKLAW